MSISHCSLPRLQDWNTAELQNRVSGTRFAFRVFDDLCRVTYDEEQGFKSRTNGPDKLCFHTSAAHHVDRSFQVQSPWISASRRWNWALWEMRRRSRQYADNCHIRVAVIDVYALLNKLDGSARSNPHIYHALELLDPDLLDRLGWKSTWSDRLPSQLQNFSNMADEILFLRHIPSSAVVSVIALDDIVGNVPGYGTGWLGSPSFRDSHAAMCSNHFSCSNWDPNLKAREYVDFALALLRPTYKDLYTGTWLLFFELVRDSSLWGDLGDFGISEAHEKANWEKMDPMACLMGGMSTLSVETPTTAKCDYSAKQHGAIARNFQIQISM
ncbi:hypothetical protein FRC08_012949 [Ceratobasidium sp. 394]|nr:hypothetical protein FRC08_012949 [Ceratobasidium sp. 394]